MKIFTQEQAEEIASRIEKMIKAHIEDYKYRFSDRHMSEKYDAKQELIELLAKDV